MTVDEWADVRVLPQYREVVAELRRLLKELAPEATETFSYNMPVWVRADIFAYLNASKTGITLSFVRGVELDDPQGKLRGKAKHARFLKYRQIDQIEKDVLRDFVEQAWAGAGD